MLPNQTTTTRAKLAYYDTQSEQVKVFYEDPFEVVAIDTQDFVNYLLNSTAHLTYLIDYNTHTGEHEQMQGQFSLEEFVEMTSARELAQIADEYVNAKLKAA